MDNVAGDIVIDFAGSSVERSLDPPRRRLGFVERMPAESRETVEHHSVALDASTESAIRTGPGQQVGGMSEETELGEHLGEHDRGAILESADHVRGKPAGEDRLRRFDRTGVLAEGVFGLREQEADERIVGRARGHLVRPPPGFGIAAIAKAGTCHVVRGLCSVLRVHARPRGVFRLEA